MTTRLMPRLLAVSLALILLGYGAEILAKGRGGSSRGGSVSVRGYYRKDGTYVRPHTRSAPDGNPYNNYSFPGNYNPNTGEITGGNPETYLQRYYNRKPWAVPGPSPSQPIFVTPPADSGGVPSQVTPSQVPAAVPAYLAPVLVPAAEAPVAPRSADLPQQHSLRSLDALDLQRPRSLDANQ